MARPRLGPHRIRTFKLSNDPKFAAKVRDIVGLHVDPPAHPGRGAQRRLDVADPVPGPHPA